PRAGPDLLPLHAALPVSGGGAGRSAGGRSGRASSFCSQVRHSGDAGEGGSPEFRARHSAASAPLTRGELSRTSSRKVENRNASTDRKSTRLNSSHDQNSY